MKKIDYENIGKKIRAKRQTKGLTIQDLAVKANSTTTTISGVETFHRGRIPQLKLLETICEALECELEDIIY